MKRLAWTTLREDLEADMTVKEDDLTACGHDVTVSKILKPINNLLLVPTLHET